MNAKIITLAVLASLISVVPANKIFAKEICFTQYGGGETCVNVDENAKINVDKKVSDENGNFQDHLKSSVHKFEAGDKVYFKIEVENNGDVDLKDVELKDVLPDFLSFGKMIDGDTPSKSGKELKWDLGDIKKGESETVKFYADVADEEDLPKDDKICLTNVAKATGKREDNDDKEDDADYSNFCIELGDVLGTESPSKLPKAGGDLTLALAGIVSAASGVLIRKKLIS